MSKSVDRPKGCSPYNYTAAFVAWCRGTPEDEISAHLGIPIETLRRVMKRERWGELQPSAPMPVAPPAEQQTAHLQRCLDNREKNLAIAEKLREDVSAVLDGLLKGKKMKRYWCHRGIVTEHEVDWTMQDRVALANYMTMVANLTYRALGDKEASTAGASDRPGGSPPPTSITLVLPGAIADRREDRPLKNAKAGEVIDLEKAFDGAKRLAGTVEVGAEQPGGSRFEPEEELAKAQREGVDVDPTE